MQNSHSDPTRPLRDGDAATSAKRPCRAPHDTQAREQRMQYERELLQRNRQLEGQLDHALIESFPASDPLAVTPEGHFPVRDPRLADDAPGDPGHPEGPAEASDGKQDERP